MKTLFVPLSSASALASEARGHATYFPSDAVDWLVEGGFVGGEFRSQD